MAFDLRSLSETRSDGLRQRSAWRFDSLYLAAGLVHDTVVGLTYFPQLRQRRTSIETDEIQLEIDNNRPSSEAVQQYLSYALPHTS